MFPFLSKRTHTLREGSVVVSLSFCFIFYNELRCTTASVSFSGNTESYSRTSVHCFLQKQTSSAGRADRYKYACHGWRVVSPGPNCWRCDAVLGGGEFRRPPAGDVWNLASLRSALSLSHTVTPAEFLCPVHRGCPTARTYPQTLKQFHSGWRIVRIAGFSSSCPAFEQRSHPVHA